MWPLLFGMSNSLMGDQYVPGQDVADHQEWVDNSVMIPEKASREALLDQA
jgi:hypothetical protein